MDLRQRTREIQHKRGIGDHPDEMPAEARLDSRYLSAVQPLEVGGDEIDNDDESDTIDGGYQERQLPYKVYLHEKLFNLYYLIHSLLLLLLLFLLLLLLLFLFLLLSIYLLCADDSTDG